MRLGSVNITIDKWCNGVRHNRTCFRDGRARANSGGVGAEGAFQGFVRTFNAEMIDTAFGSNPVSTFFETRPD